MLLQTAKHALGASLSLWLLQLFAVAAVLSIVAARPQNYQQNYQGGQQSYQGGQQYQGSQGGYQSTQGGYQGALQGSPQNIVSQRVSLDRIFFAPLSIFGFDLDIDEENARRRRAEGPSAITEIVISDAPKFYVNKKMTPSLGLQRTEPITEADYETRTIEVRIRWIPSSLSHPGRSQHA